jgi:hypothetical protein
MGDQIKDYLIRKFDTSYNGSSSNGRMAEGSEFPISTTPIEERTEKDLVVKKLYQGPVGIRSTDIHAVDSKVSLSQLEKAILAVNKGQMEFERLNKIDSSRLLRSMVDAQDRVYNIFGRNQAENSIYTLFPQQQRNIRYLNESFARFILSYTNSIEQTRITLDKLVAQTKHEALLVHKVDEELPGHLKDVELEMEQLGKLDRKKDPEKFFTTYEKMLNLRRDGRGIREIYVIGTVASENHFAMMEGLQQQEELFETIIQRAKEMAVLTELYQQALDTNFPIWSNTEGVSRAIRIVSNGIRVLSEYNRQLNDRYITTIGEINGMVADHPGLAAINETNAGIGRLNATTQSKAFESLLPYLNHG